PLAFARCSRQSGAATQAHETTIYREMSLFRTSTCNISRPYRFTSALRDEGTVTRSYERSIADKLDEGTHCLCTVGRARPDQSADGSPDARLSDARPAYGARPCPHSWRFEARRYTRLEYARRARLSPPREGPGRQAQCVRRPHQQWG